MSSPSEQTLVGMGEVAVARDQGTLAALGLGSCVAVVLYDRSARVGALAHILLPSRSLSRDHMSLARTADTAIPHVVREVTKCGAEPARLTARLVGGASMFSDLLAAGAIHIGERNVVACRLSLRKEGIPIVGEAVGGQAGRSLWFDVADGRVTVRSVGHEPADL